MKYNIILNFGYAESSSLSYIPFSSEEDFESSKDAVIDLANFFKKAISDGTPPLKKCCQSNKDKGNEYCSKCGTNLVEGELEAEQYINFVNEIEGANLDSYAGSFIEYDPEDRWKPSAIEVKGHINIIVYVAESVLAAAVGLSPNGKVNSDTIFADKNAESFSFW